MAQLLDRLDDRFALLTGGDRLAPARQRSLAATVEWSYQLLDEHERRVFRAVSVFPGPFTLEAAEAVAGPGAGPVVLRLVDCSLLVPPRAGPDGRSRYVMLETLRAYGAGLLAEAGEQDGAAAALAGYALRVAGAGRGGLQTVDRGAGRGPAGWMPRTPPCGRCWPGRWSTIRPRRCGWRSRWRWWWVLRGRLAGQYPLLCRGRRARRAGQRRVVRRAALARLGRAGLGRSGRGAGPFHRGPRRRRGPAGRPGRWPTPWPAGRRHCGRWAGPPRRPSEARRALALAREIGLPGRGGAGPGRAQPRRRLRRRS